MKFNVTFLSQIKIAWLIWQESSIKILESHVYFLQHYMKDDKMEE
jgi:hypothetical protein